VEGPGRDSFAAPGTRSHQDVGLPGSLSQTSKK
jgi:hypothetical protein